LEVGFRRHRDCSRVGRLYLLRSSRQINLNSIVGQLQGGRRRGMRAVREAGRSAAW
jgi:hypothetical protein